MKPTKVTVRQLRDILKSYPKDAIVVGQWDGQLVEFGLDDIYLLKNEDGSDRKQPVVIIDVSDCP